MNNHHAAFPLHAVASCVCACACVHIVLVCVGLRLMLGVFLVFLLLSILGFETGFFTKLGAHQFSNSS